VEPGVNILDTRLVLKNRLLLEVLRGWCSGWASDSWSKGRVAGNTVWSHMASDVP